MVKMEDEKRNLYEGVYIISAVLSEEARSKALDRIKTGITHLGGEIQNVLEMGRRRLAYDINGRREGYYYFIYFENKASALAELRREYHLNEDLVRYMLLRTEEVCESFEFKPLVQQ
jgi:small subunit ribosomal protein S6